MQQFIGRVIQTARNKTVKVSVERSLKKKEYLKPSKISKNYLVYDETNKASIGDIVEIVYKGKDELNRSFKINQIIKESQKYINPINGKNYSFFGTRMVLPWISDRSSPAIQNGLLGCPYFDYDNNEIIFSYDNRHTNNLKQSNFYNLKNSLPENKFGSEKEKQISELRSLSPNCYFPSSSIEICMNENECNSSHKFNKFNFKNNSQVQGQYFAIYPEISNNTIAIDFINEIELSSCQSALNIFDRQEVCFPFIVNQIKSYDGSSFAALSSQTIKLFHYSEGAFCEAFECIAPDDDYFITMNIGRHELETSSILKNAKKLIIKDLHHKQEFPIIDDFFSCAYSSHPALLVLSGNSNKIELKDRRHAFPGLFISDRNVPFQGVHSLIPHDSDENLLAISCETDYLTDKSKALNECRIYDIRYPKESILRISSSAPISEFAYFDSYFGERSDNLIGIDDNSNLFRWEFWHSKSNNQFMDGILSLSDFRKLSKNKTQMNSETTEYLGHSVSRSSVNENKLFLARLSRDGELDYCIISNSEKDFPDSEPNEIFEDIGNSINFSYFSEDYTRKLETKQSRSIDLQQCFAPALQSTFHLDFYWDEVKSKICKK